MNLFEKLNYYEMLDISPDATPFEVRHAYNMALQVYENSSMASYSFFSEEEREKILARLEAAFSTLINEKTRVEYDRMLIRLGVLEDESKKGGVSKKQRHASGLKKSETIKAVPTVNSEKTKSKIYEEILAQDVITGVDLKRMRAETGIKLEDIAERTKIWIEFLRYIENDQFDRLPSRFHLKGFLKAYVQHFSADVDTVVDRYMKRIED